MYIILMAAYRFIIIEKTIDPVLSKKEGSEAVSLYISASLYHKQIIFFIIPTKVEKMSYISNLKNYLQ